MAALLSWLAENWFNLLQGAGIVAGLCFTALSLRQETSGRKVSDLLALTEQHRELWSELHRRPKLQRVLCEEVNLVEKPITPAEAEFLNVVIVHFNTGWLLAKAGALVTKDGLAKDIRAFFALPLPHLVWQQTRHTREPRFRRFVAAILRNHVS